MPAENNLGISFATYIPIIANRRRAVRECEWEERTSRGFRDPANSRVSKRHSSKASTSALRCRTGKVARSYACARAKTSFRSALQTSLRDSLAGECILSRLITFA